MTTGKKVEDESTGTRGSSSAACGVSIVFFINTVIAKSNVLLASKLPRRIRLQETNLSFFYSKSNQPHTHTPPDKDLWEKSGVVQTVIRPSAQSEAFDDT